MSSGTRTELPTQSRVRLEWRGTQVLGDGVAVEWTVHAEVDAEVGGELIVDFATLVRLISLAVTHTTSGRIG